MSLYNRRPMFANRYPRQSGLSFYAGQANESVFKICEKCWHYEYDTSKYQMCFRCWKKENGDQE